MPGPRQVEYFQIEQETAYGTAATFISTSPGIPWESYDVVQENAVEVRAKMTGFIDNMNVDVAGQDLAGSSSAEIHPDNATLLLKTIPGIPRVTFNGNPHDLPTFTGRFYDIGTRSYFRHLSLKCNQARISCAGPNGELMVNYDWLGKSETEHALFAQPSMPDQASFQMKHAWASDVSLIKVATVSEPNAESFDITIPNNLRLGERRNDSGFREAIDPGVRGDIAVSMNLRSDAASWAVNYHGLVRGQNTGTRLEYAFNYPGTGSPVDSISILLPSAVIQRCQRTGGVKDVQTLSTTWIAKRTAGQEAIVITVS